MVPMDVYNKTLVLGRVTDCGTLCWLRSGRLKFYTWKQDLYILKNGPTQNNHHTAYPKNKQDSEER